MTNEQIQYDDNEQLTKKHIRGSSLLFVGRLFSVAMKAVFQVLIVRYLVKADYGAFAYAMSIVEIGAIISLVNLDHAASRFVPLYHEKSDYNAIFGFMVMSVFTVFGIGISIIVLLYSTQSIVLRTLIRDELTLILLMILIVLTPLQAMDSWFQSIFAVFSSVKQIFFRRYLFAPALHLSVAIFVIVSQLGIYSLTIGYLVAGLLGFGLYLTMMVNLLRRKNLIEHFDWRNLTFKPAEIFGFSLPLLSASIVFIFRTQLVVVLLEYFRGLVAVAEYRAMYPIAKLNGVIYMSFVMLYLPLASRMFSRGDENGINDLYWRTAGWIAIASFPIFVVTFVLAPEFVPALLGEQYRSASSVMAILAVGFYVSALMGFNIHTLRAYGKVRYLVIVDVIVIIATVIAYLIFIPLYGALGGAIASTVSIIISNILNHLGLVYFTKVKLYNSEYTQVYITLAMAIALVSVVQIVFEPRLWFSLPFVTFVSLILLWTNASKLDVEETFPELLKVPILKHILK